VHPLLARQLRKALIDQGDLSEQMQKLLNAVSDAYVGADEDRRQLERSLSLASEDLYERNRRLENELEERKRLQSELLEATRNAEAASRAKGDFLANMSHEIRTPMNGVTGMTDLLLQTRLDQEQRDYANAIRECAAALLTLINDILDFSKIEAGKLEIERIDICLRDTVQEVARLLAVQAHAKGLEITVQVDPAVPDFVKADPNRIRQILLNLGGNAVKFTQRGEVALSLRVLEQRGAGTLIRGEVRDTGIGIPPDRLATLFKPFTQVDTSTTRKFGGTGLGLSIVRRLTELMGGDTGVESEVGRGSVFWFTLQLDRSEKTKSPPDLPIERGDERSYSSASRAPTHRARILLAEDNIVNQKVATRMLEKMNCEVHVAADGEAAVAAWRTGRFDLIFMDCQMPVLDGYEACRTIRRLENGAARIPIVALTAHAMKGDDAICFGAGMDGYLTKPVDRESLSAILQRYLG